MLNIPEYKEYAGETKIALMDNSSLAFMHELSQRSYPSDGILSVYDLILIPKWVMEEIEDSTYRSTYVEQLQAQGYPIRWIDETKYGAFVNDEDVNLYYIVEAAVSRVSELMRFLRRKVKTEDLIDLPSAEEWMNRLYDEWPIHGRTLSTGRTLKKNAGEISLTILAEIFAWYHDGVDSLTIYTQDTDAHEFQTNAERILTGNSEFTPALDSPISVAFKSNDFILCQMYREGALTLDAVRQLRHDDRKLTYTRQQADKSIICRKEVITKEQFIDLIQDATVQMLHVRKRNRQKYSEACRPILGKYTDGWAGRIIDLLAVFALLAGTATTFSVATPLMATIISELFHVAVSRTVINIIILLITCAVYTYSLLHGFKGILLILLPIALLFAESSMNNLQSVSIVAAFPIGAVIVMIAVSFMKDAKKYMEELSIKK